MFPNSSKSCYLQTSCTLDWEAGGPGGYALVVCLFVCIIGLNVLVIGCSYGGIIFTLRKQRKQVVPTVNTPSMASRRAEKKTSLVSSLHSPSLNHVK